MGGAMKNLPSMRDRPWVQWLAVMLFICFGLLFQETMGPNNEVDVLPLARQFAQPEWIPADWYLNQPAGYRFLFSGIVGWMAATWGFWVTSVVGRLVCFGLVSWGLVGIGRRLQLSLPFLLLAIALFLYNSSDQGVAAEEWIVGSLEAKAVAYGLVLGAIAALLGGHYRRMALLLGLATSFHVLVGGWAMVTVVGWWIWRWWVGRSPHPPAPDSPPQDNPLVLGALYGGGAVLALPAVVKQVFSPTPEGDIAPSFVYVFLRLSHHLNPYGWPIWCWTRLAAFAALFGILVGLFLWQRSHWPRSQAAACQNWVVLVLCSLVPYGLGLLLAPLDTQGRWLQYYPFRLGDVLLPLGTCFLLACLLERGLRRWHPRIEARVGVALLAIFAIGQTILLGLQIPAIAAFPGEDQEVNPPWAELCAWVRQNTPPNSRFVIMPMDRASFTWLAERPIVVSYKFLPQTADEIVEWYHRMDAVTGGTFTRLMQDPDRLRHTLNIGREIRQQLREGFSRLDTEGAIALMDTYDAPYFLTRSWHRLDLEVVYEGFPYRLYRMPSGS